MLALAGQGAAQGHADDLAGIASELEHRRHGQQVARRLQIRRCRAARPGEGLHLDHDRLGRVVLQVTTPVASSGGRSTRVGATLSEAAAAALHQGGDRTAMRRAAASSSAQKVSVTLTVSV